MNERRHSSRFKIDLAARYRLMASKDAVYRMTVINIGAEGVCFVAKHLVELDTEIGLQINLHGREKIFIRTKAVWVKNLKETREFWLG